MKAVVHWHDCTAGEDALVRRYRQFQRRLARLKKEAKRIWRQIEREQKADD